MTALVLGHRAGIGGVVASPNAALAGPAAFGYRGELHVGSAQHLRARQYVPRLGVFGEVDPIDAVDGEASLGNPYHYGGNDPVNHSDPSGMCRVRDPLGRCRLTNDKVKVEYGP